MRASNEGHIVVIGRLRKFLANAFGYSDTKGGSSGASTAAQSSEGKSTDEAEKPDKDEPRTLGDEFSKRKDRFNINDDNDLDVS